MPKGLENYSEVKRIEATRHARAVVDDPEGEMARRDAAREKFLQDLRASAGQPGRQIAVGDVVLMDVAQGWSEIVVIKEIADGIVYGTTDDGEDVCAPLDYCDKAPI